MSAPAGVGRATSSATPASIISARLRRARAARWRPPTTKYAPPSLTVTIGGKPPSANACLERAHPVATEGVQRAEVAGERAGTTVGADESVERDWRTPRYRRPNGFSRRSTSRARAIGHYSEPSVLSSSRPSLQRQQDGRSWDRTSKRETNSAMQRRSKRSRPGSRPAPNATFGHPIDHAGFQWRRSKGEAHRSATPASRCPRNASAGLPPEHPSDDGA